MSPLPPSLTDPLADSPLESGNPFMSRSIRLIILLACFCSGVWADVAVPPRVLDPQSAAEAWNVIRLVRANTARLLRENRLSEIPVQISLCSPALRLLGSQTVRPGARARLGELTALGLASINAVASGGMAGNRAMVERDFVAFETTLKEVASFFDASQVDAEIAACPMHPDIVSSDPKTPCARCGMHLITRRIPYSFVYTQPGEPSIVLAARADAPLAAGRKAQVEIQLKGRDGAPVVPDDLLVMHTERIHLLIVDSSLEDYHHEHPMPTDTPGAYTFSFTPAKNARYRIFADLVPVATSVQEYPSVDLPGVAEGSPVAPAPGTFASSSGGLNFELSFPGLNGQMPAAGQIQNMTITVTDASGRPVRNLEPVMNAFAHVVGFHQDYRTVVHLHPTGGDILRQDLRGGPSMGFKFFPPKAGFVRLYCQVCVDGKMVFAPFNVQVAP